MSQLVDKILREVCLDERVSDGIFKMENENHMNALRDYFVNRGITKEDAIHVTNRMVEGKFPERQAYNADGILCTFPTPKHKKKAIQRGTHFEENPAPQNTPPPKEDSPEEPIKREPPVKEEPEEENPSMTGGKEPNIFGGPEGQKVDQGGKELEIEPPRGNETPPPIPVPSSPTPVAVPRTPERVAAEKEVVKQIINTDDTTLSNINPPELNEKLFKHQLNEMYKKCDEWGFREMKKFLSPYVKS